MATKNTERKVGSYAISTVDLNSWMNEPVAQTAAKSRKTKGVKEVINKIFADCAQVCHDPFWAEKFNLAATGKLPSKFSYHDGILTYRKGAKCHTLEVVNNRTEAAYACMDFFRSNGGIFSPTDEQNSIELQYQRSNSAASQEKITWATANKKAQECLLSYFILSMKDVMKLKDIEVKQLRQVIGLGITNKYFGKTNIQIDNNRIAAINGLLWDANTRLFYINPDLTPNIVRSSIRKKDANSVNDNTQKDMIPQFGVRWEKYVDTLSKKNALATKRRNRIRVNNTEPVIRKLNIIGSTDITSPKSPSSPTSPKSPSAEDDEEE